MNFFFIVPFGLLVFDLFLVLCLTWKVQDSIKAGQGGHCTNPFYIIYSNTLSKRRNDVKYLANLNKTSYP